MCAFVHVCTCVVNLLEHNFCRRKSRCCLNTSQLILSTACEQPGPRSASVGSATGDVFTWQCRSWFAAVIQKLHEGLRVFSLAISLS